MRLTAHVDRTEIDRGTIARATFRLENVTSRPVTLDFGSACTVLPFVIARATNELVYPLGGGWGCAQVVTQLTLAPHEVRETELDILAGGIDIFPLGLPPGKYELFARLDDNVHRLESPRVVIEVR